MAELELKGQIAEAEKAINEAVEAINKAKIAGIDTAELEAELEEQKTALAKLKEAYA